MNRLRACFIILILALTAHLTLKSSAGQAPRQDYLVYVVCESADKIALIRFGQQGARVEHMVLPGKTHLEAHLATGDPEGDWARKAVRFIAEN